MGQDGNKRKKVTQVTINGKDRSMTLDMNKMGVVFWKQRIERSKQAFT